MEGIFWSCLQTKDIIEYLKRLSKTSIPDGIVKFIGVSVKDLKLTIPSSQGWASSVNFNCYSTCIFIWTYNLSVCVCMWISKPLRLPVGVCVYIRLCASLYSLYMYITAYCSFLLS